MPLREVIETHGLWAKKSLGQHFLLDTNLLEKIVRASGAISGSHVIEIGPGPGGLTRAILNAGPRHLTAIEKDARCIAALAPLRAAYPETFTLHEADALAVDLSQLGDAPRMVIANLPYNVGTQLIIDWLQQAAQQGPQALSGFTVMLQKEVAERMVAQVGDAAYGRLSVLMQQLTDAAILFEVPASAFTPPPKVTSAILRARILERPREEVPLKLLERVVAAAFNHRRKMLRQSLKSLGVEAVALCEKAGIDPTLRAEACDLPMFARLARALAETRDKPGDV
ncbi:MAG: 16S rRNA (adenine(1518)-N(6)/adenine(1519)-N(6))-dimethyltransferase RsmA [Alphaproteobacteria bacterium]|nr:16S rRNA (adenine(1518)-N(6)/adenine(1519)-N(6))-dimethyltransferase RsmA [Alphaproteobacteria bacterium]